MFFKVGDIVQWTSQSANIERTKQGEVVRVLDEYEVPKESEVRGAGAGRNHESYLVKACVIDGSEAQRKRKRLYWPKVKYLELVQSRE